VQQRFLPWQNIGPTYAPQESIFLRQQNIEPIYAPQESAFKKFTIFWWL